MQVSNSRSVLLAAIALSGLPQSNAHALPSGYLDPSSVSIKTGTMRVESKSSSVVNFTIINLTDKGPLAVAVECTALVGGEPVETNSGLPDGVGAHQTAYGSVRFLQVKGDPTATASCRISYVRLE